MIKKITIQNFFSFGSEQTIELNADTNVLVGINGTGKSNFIKAIRLLKAYLSANEFEKLFMQKWGGFSGACNFIHPDASAIYLHYEFDKKVVKTLINDFVKNDLHIDFTIKKVGSSYDILERDTTLEFTDKLLEGIEIYDYFDTSFESSIRQLSPYYSEENLLSDGKNLTALLSYLNGNSVKAFDKLLEEFKKINQNFRELVFTTPVAGKSLLSLKEKNLDRAITIEHISDGTLRYLLLLSIFYNPKRGSVICLDEPEMGLHPDMINGIARGIKYAAENGTQMIIATHSPLLLNAFELEDLMIFEKNDTNETIVKKVSEEDFPEWEGDFLAGQMWLRGKIGGTRW
ncbi:MULTISPECIES: AAA family ATPase [unclassified Arcicella]|uniref:AAA family ATPase n=1 Tax=unclassified Arcicella TaxID=2644986 RepID=UPI0028568846|nr:MULTISPECIES: AAA family ATPase [unclassified Arcicella]MDR6560194.1 putative ATPase [Arcicella sp. BE51]MDR6810199.1 putative ATPase [Arcicella sp. BE140]MDR6821549.1 putative ATPase [Arcicella sp. BE139]